jgi:hypothetical protein
MRDTAGRRIEGERQAESKRMRERRPCGLSRAWIFLTKRKKVQEVPRQAISAATPVRGQSSHSERRLANLVSAYHSTAVDRHQELRLQARRESVRRSARLTTSATLLDPQTPVRMSDHSDVSSRPSSDKPNPTGRASPRVETLLSRVLDRRHAISIAGFTTPENRTARL